ncbi:major facilitator superfamily domain-containing protein [Cercophora scortea]|uniref:Major facilitator superfamily domain-containing protein n=1 Tax=Cercophora scortea TaxID=314031 RepID=A0AAE0IPF2_9PEZI|nr:major facilitator superfamily domain-containing protein [Cercophora scortea]
MSSSVVSGTGSLLRIEEALVSEAAERGSDEREALLPLPLAPAQDSEIGNGLSTSRSLLAFMAPALLAGIIVKAFDIAFLSTSYARIASDLNHFKDASWVVLTDSICSAMFVPLYSYLLKSLGMKRMIFVAYGSFAFGIGLCAISTSFGELLGSRLVVGLGSSGITLLSMIIINEIVGMKQLAIWESFVTCIEMATSMAAGPLGASMYRRFTWHSVFYLELAFSILGLVVLSFSFANIKSHPQHAQSVLAKKGDSRVPRIDVEGWLLLVLAVCTPLIALTLGDNFLDWTHPIEILLLVSSPIFMFLFVLFESKAAKAPMFDMKPIFKIPYLRVLLQVFFVISIFNSILSITPPYIQVRAFDGPSFEDWALTCVFLGFPAGAILGGYLAKAETLSVPRIMLANAALLQLSCVLYLTRAIKPESARYSPLLFAFGFCIGIWQSCLLYATLSTTQKQWWPQTLAMYYLVETFGADLGTSMMSTITRSVAKSGIRSSLGNSPETERIITEAMQNLQSVRLLDEKSRAQVLSAFEHAMHTSFFLPCAMAAAVVFLAASMNMFPVGKTGHELTSEDHEHGDGRNT